MEGGGIGSFKQADRQEGGTVTTPLPLHPETQECCCRGCSQEDESVIQWHCPPELRGARDRGDIQRHLHGGPGLHHQCPGQCGCM